MLRFGYPKKSDEDLEQLMQKFDTNGSAFYYAAFLNFVLNCNLLFALFPTPAFYSYLAPLTPLKATNLAFVMLNCLLIFLCI